MENRKRHLYLVVDEEGSNNNDCPGGVCPTCNQKIKKTSGRVISVPLEYEVILEIIKALAKMGEG